jgi:hypothetical protein
MADLNNDMQNQGRIIMTIKDLVVMYDCNRITAWRKLTQIKEYFKKPENGGWRWKNRHCYFTKKYRFNCSPFTRF